eukprot:g4790.t1
MIKISQCELAQLPAFGDNEEMAAPLAFFDFSNEVHNCTIRDNDANFRSGAVIVDGESNVNFFNSVFRDNRGRHGVVLMRSKSNARFESCNFTRNSGIEVGVARVFKSSVAVFMRCTFVSNSGRKLANEVSVSSQGRVVLHSSRIYGNSANLTFTQYLMDPNRSEDELESFEIPQAGVVDVSGRAYLHVLECYVSGHSGRRGAVYASGADGVFMSQSEFANNTAVYGAGLYINADRGGFIKIQRMKFTNNVARFGGALVVAGNGSYTIDTCNFWNNTALHGGAIWGDYSTVSLGGRQTCPKANVASRVTILTTKFTSNRAVINGGAMWFTCTNIFSANCTFDQNVASQSNGGSIYATGKNTIQFIRCNFFRNHAGLNGGALHVNQSNQLNFELCSFRGNNAEAGDGGTILSISGSSLTVTDSRVDGSSSGANGGAFFTEDIKQISFQNSVFNSSIALRAGGVLFGRDINQFSWRSVSVNFNTANRSGAVHIKKGTVFYLQEVQFRDNNSTVQNTGAVGLEDVRTVQVNHSIFESNLATESCGIIHPSIRLFIHVLSLICSVINSEFKKNTAQISGGAMCLVDSGLLNMKSVVLQQNSANRGDGGAVQSTRVEKMSLKQTTRLTNNKANRGGAINGLSVKILEIEESFLMDNFAVFVGGAIRLKSSSVSLLRAEFFRNKAGDSTGPSLPSTLTDAVERRYSGGAMYVVDGVEFNASNTQFFWNEASLSGGSLSLTRISRVNLNGVHFAKSKAETEGGCILGHTIRTATLSNTFFADCQAKVGGAGVFSGRTMLSGVNNTFRSNKADTGGAILCYGRTQISFGSSFFLHNSANEGSTLTANCDCQVAISYSEIRRDDKLPDNGDFFEIEDECESEVRLRSNSFSGGKSEEGTVWYVWVIIAVSGAVLFIGSIIICCCRKKKIKASFRKRTNGGIESTTRSRKPHNANESTNSRMEHENYETRIEKEESSFGSEVQFPR